MKDYLEDALDFFMFYMKTMFKIAVPTFIVLGFIFIIYKGCEDAKEQQALEPKCDCVIEVYNAQTDKLISTIESYYSNNCERDGLVDSGRKIYRVYKCKEISNGRTQTRSSGINDSTWE